MKVLYLEINDPDPAVDHWKPLSYVVDWREAILSDPSLRVELCNINNTAHYGACLKSIGDYDLIVVSHAATGDDMTKLLATRAGFDGRKGKLAVFIGNEYDIMGEKIAFIRASGAEYICTQLPRAAAEWLYQGCHGSTILSLPHGLNPRRYRPLPGTSRDMDIGFIGDIYFPWIGDMERTNFIEFVAKHGKLLNLVCDIRTQRIPGDEWCSFLNRSKGIIGAESGTYYLNGRGELLKRAKEHMQAHAETTFRQLFDLYFKNVSNPVSGKAISSRHFEPIGTMTCQLLLEGEYNGILRAEEHYIPVRRDLSNIVEAVQKFKDARYRQTMVERTYEYVMTSHTYRHRVRQLVRSVSEDTGEHRTNARGQSEAPCVVSSRPSRAPAKPERVDAYWSDFTVLAPAFASAKESLDYLEWRFDQYPHFRELMGLYGNHKGQVVVDYGCGPGNDLVGFLVHSQAERVIGIDVSAKALDLARKRLALHSVDPRRIELLQVSDKAAAIPLPDGGTDYIYCEGVLHHTSHPFEILQEFARVLKPRGQSCIMVYNRNSLWWHLYTAYQRMILENAFPGLSLREAFTRNIDGEDCPIAHAYAPEEFVSLCEKAGFKTQFLGGYLSKLELEVLQELYAPALADTRLPEEHKAFLRALKPDASGYPLYQGKYAGIGGVYSLSLPINAQR